MAAQLLKRTMQSLPTIINSSILPSRFLLPAIMTRARAFSQLPVNHQASSLPLPPPVSTTGGVKKEVQGPLCYEVITGEGTKLKLSSMIKNLTPRIDSRSQSIFNKWANITELECPYYYVKMGNDLVGFALLHRTECHLQDRFNPYVLDLVYVDPQWRHHGMARDIIKPITRDHEVHSFCPDDESTAVLEKAGFTHQGTCNCLKSSIMSYP